mmetsp:Transcript_34163/g.72690  ORF Transcript_34163/g.72690 Transcript_34163/m.72690 type:complete len:327 (-) Transcript_34163:267-1247(-)
MLDGGERVLGLVHSHQEVVLRVLCDRATLDHTVLDIIPCLWTQARLAVSGQGFSYSDLLQGRTCDEVLESFDLCAGRYLTTDLEDVNVSTANADVQAQVHSFDAGVEHVKPLMDLYAASRRSQHCCGHGPKIGQAVGAVGRNHTVVLLALGVIYCLEVYAERVARKLDDIAPIVVDQIDERSEEILQTEGEKLGSVASLRELLCQLGETARVGEDHGSFASMNHDLARCEASLWASVWARFEVGLLQDPGDKGESALKGVSVSFLEPGPDALAVVPGWPASTAVYVHVVVGTTMRDASDLGATTRFRGRHVLRGPPRVVRRQSPVE